MNQVTKLLYVGAGYNMKPIQHFNNTKLFVFVDAQPRDKQELPCRHFSKKRYNKTFYLHLVEEYKKHHFILESCFSIDDDYQKTILNWKQRLFYSFRKLPPHLNPTLLVFKNETTEQTVRYYISTSLLCNVTSMLANDIVECDGLVVSNHQPHVELLKYIQKPICFFGYTGTNYKSKTVYKINKRIFYSLKRDTIIYFLKTQVIQYYFKDFYIVLEDNGITYRCLDFKEFLIMTCQIKP